MELLSRKEELILLAIWKLGDNAYGITIRDELENTIGVSWLFGSIYTPLNHLYDKGLISRLEGETTSERGGRPKIYFSLTPKGKEALARVKELNSALWTEIPPITLK
ncbi:MAG: PadR family transcriptional regulator [bacterium]|nr:PadR family transcriptional regulator [bacterium]